MLNINGKLGSSHVLQDFRLEILTFYEGGKLGAVMLFWNLDLDF
jgi:hypothetical protein